MALAANPSFLLLPSMWCAIIFYFISVPAGHPACLNMFLGNCATIFHSLNDSVATTYIPNMAGITPIKNTTRVLVQASCVLHAYSEGDFSREILQVNHFISYLDLSRPWLDPKIGFIKRPTSPRAFQQRRLNLTSSTIYNFREGFKGVSLKF